MGLEPKIPESSNPGLRFAVTVLDVKARALLTHARQAMCH